MNNYPRLLMQKKLNGDDILSIVCEDLERSGRLRDVLVCHFKGLNYRDMKAEALFFRPDNPAYPEDIVPRMFSYKEVVTLVVHHIMRRGPIREEVAKIAAEARDERKRAARHAQEKALDRTRDHRTDPGQLTPEGSAGPAREGHAPRPQIGGTP